MRKMPLFYRTMLVLGMMLSTWATTSAAELLIRSDGPFGYLSERGDGWTFYNAVFGSSNNDDRGIVIGDNAGPSNGLPRDVEARGIMYFDVAPLQTEIAADQKITHITLGMYEGAIRSETVGSSEVNRNFSLLFPDGIELWAADNGYFGPLASPFNLNQTAAVEAGNGSVTNAAGSEGFDFIDASLVGDALSTAIPGSGGVAGTGRGVLMNIQVNDSGIELFETLASDTGTLELRIQFANTGETNALIPSGHPANNDQHDDVGFFSGTVTQQQGALPAGFDARPLLTVIYTTATESIAWPLQTSLFNDNAYALDNDSGSIADFDVELELVNGVNSEVVFSSPYVDVNFLDDMGSPGPAVTVAPTDAGSIKTSNRYLTVHGLLRVPQAAIDDSTTSNGIAMTLEFQTDADPGTTHTLALPIPADRLGELAHLQWDLTTGEFVHSDPTPATNAGDPDAADFWTGNLTSLKLNLFGSGDLAGTNGWTGLESRIFLIGFGTKKYGYPIYNGYPISGVRNWTIYE